MKLQAIIEQHWYTKTNIILSIILFPLCVVFYVVSKVRYYSYKYKLLKSYQLPIPVVIVGNISVGGAGKTPLTQHLVTELEKSGIKAGVILRGYKGENRQARIVTATDDSKLVGDEALIYAKNGVKVAIGANRYEAGITLLNAYPELQLVIADDGLQHYRLKRDYEIAVIDSTRMLGNNFLLPMGPLRETASRLKTVNAVVINGGSTQLPENLCTYMPHLVVTQNLVLAGISNPVTGQFIEPTTLKTKKILALAAIGNPERFFNFLRDLSITLDKTLAFPDHYPFQAHDLPSTHEVILVTEKDYVKLSPLNNDRIWVVKVTTKLNNDLLLSQVKNLKAYGLLHTV
jgi:tetraacyldisaccharide 4'-kinase